MAYLLAFIGPVFDTSVGYKTIERLYSDEELELVLHNLSIMLLEETGVSGQVTGDRSDRVCWTPDGDEIFTQRTAFRSSMKNKVHFSI